MVKKAEYEDDPEGVAALSGHAHENHENEIADLLTSQIMQTAQLLTLLSETTEEEFKQYKNRFAIWRNLVAQIPLEFPKKPTLGFKVHLNEDCPLGLDHDYDAKAFKETAKFLKRLKKKAKKAKPAR